MTADRRLLYTPAPGHSHGEGDWTPTPEEQFRARVQQELEADPEVSLGEAQRRASIEHPDLYRAARGGTR